MNGLPPLLYQDDQVVAFNKPCGLLSVPGRGPDKIDSLSYRAQKRFPKAEIVHRLDCYTSGIMLLALGKTVQSELNRQFREREVEKEYVAIVHGVVEEDSGIVDVPIRLDIDNRPLQIVDYQQGKPSETHWQVIERTEDKTRLRLIPITGRSHQLRVHCALLGHPIVGDHFYGVDADAEVTTMLLHARRIEFTHPSSFERIVIEAPSDF